MLELAVVMDDGGIGRALDIQHQLGGRMRLTLEELGQEPAFTAQT